MRQVVPSCTTKDPTWKSDTGAERIISFGTASEKERKKDKGAIHGVAIKKSVTARCWKLTPIILATQEAERSGGSRFEASPGK
jgi:hypothetical protein